MTRSVRFAFFVLALANAGLLHANGTPAALADAAEAQDQQSVSRLIGLGADLDAAQADGMTALHWACFHEEADMALALLRAGASPSSKTRYDVSPLSIAASNANAVLVAQLLRYGADPNTTLPGDESALMTAARAGRLAPVAALVAAGAHIDATVHEGQTATFWAAHEGHLEVVRFLIDSGADYTTPLDSGYTPFFVAVRQGHAELVRLFLERGIEVNSAMSVKDRGSKLAENGTSALILAMENGHFDLALELLQRGADPNDSRTGLTPLHTLVHVRKPDRGEGADGMPPPRIDGDLSSEEFARALVAHGAQINARLTEGPRARGARFSKIGCTPFLLASDTADVPFMNLLLELGADPTIPNEDNVTPLMVAAGVGSHAPEEEAGTPDECLEAVKLLVSLGADVNAVSDHGETAMHGAAYKNAPQVAAYLDSQGADIQIWNTKNRDGRTPLFIAEGYRPGNFKPDFATVEVIRGLMEKHAVAIPKERPKHVNYAP